MDSEIIQHLALALVLSVPLLVVPLVVVLRLPKPESPNRFGAPSHPAASGQALIRGLRRTFVFTGRASRSEFWWFLFWAAAVYAIVCIMLFKAAAIEEVSLIVVLATSFFPFLLYLPLLSVAVRRLQDANRSGLWVLLAFGGFSVLALLLLLAEPARDDVLNVEQEDGLNIPTN